MIRDKSIYHDLSSVIQEDSIYSHGDKGEDGSTNPAGSVGVEIQKTDCEAAQDHSKVEP
jgi:hypothetical protein